MWGMERHTFSKVHGQARLNDTVLSLLPGEGIIVGTYGRMYGDV